ncbi:hypothetical protein K2173_005716 [Erythroxylum novogranatense]|uniref:Uncharacterized protein n=1 Tax=Erythroxylum novogranatense TaxID=1862640 RepID=A0AAV8SQN6_9ROSI|nr:hypothetical protein K2173_005716 [Erythroxylum novogranatense]
MSIDVETSGKKTPSAMSRQVLARNRALSPSQLSSTSSSSSDRRRPLLGHSHSDTSYYSGRFAEFAGGTTAECAAICCCCPCGLANLLILTIYKVPAGLCRRALQRKRRQRLIKKGLLPPRTRRCQCGCDDTEIQIHPATGFSPLSAEEITSFRKVFDKDEESMLRLEKEMWDTFYSTGFWRSPSQREPPIISSPRDTTPRAKVKQM